MIYTQLEQNLRHLFQIIVIVHPEIKNIVKIINSSVISITVDGITIRNTIGNLYNVL